MFGTKHFRSWAMVVSGLVVAGVLVGCAKSSSAPAPQEPARAAATPETEAPAPGATASEPVAEKAPAEGGRPEARAEEKPTAEEPKPDQAKPEAKESAAAKPMKKSELLVELPDYCNTPDAMALLPDGSIVLSVPNFNDLAQPPLLARITPDNKVEKFFDLPNNPDTGKPFGPLGVCVAPSGDLFLADFQMTGDHKSRVVRVVMKGGKPQEVVPVVTGFAVSNAVIVRDGYLYVSETQLDSKAKPALSGVFRFKLEELDNKEPVRLKVPGKDDPHLIATIETFNEELPLGADGLCFDKKGNLYVGNFSDGTVHRLQFDAEGKVTSNTIFAKSAAMKSADGLFFDPREDKIYVADSKANAIQVVSPDGSVATLAQNGETDGLDGGMDQPCEALVRGNEVIVSNMDWPVPGCINKKYDKPCTLSVIKLD